MYANHLLTYLDRVQRRVCHAFSPHSFNNNKIILEINHFYANALT